MEGKWIDGFDKRYKIFEDGSVISYVQKNPRLMKSVTTRRGYKQIGLCEDGKGGRQNFITIHRLVGIHFIPNPENKKCIDHKDGDKLNNSIVNLRWVSHHENMLNVHNIGKYKKGVHFNKKNKKFVAQIHLNGKRKHLGCFETEDEAHEVYKAKFLEVHGIECCLR